MPAAAKGPFVTADVGNDGRLQSPVYQRNTKPVTDGLLSFASPLTGTALEIGSGTGEHICTFANALPNLRWQPSDPDPLHRNSIDLWANHHGLDLPASLNLDASAPWWDLAPIKTMTPISLILSMNVIHIAPFSVAKGIFNGAGKTLQTGGYLAFYGPFKENGTHTGDGNAQFDARLRSENPDWGIRDIDTLTGLAKTQGLTLDQVIPMPANNRILAFQRKSG